MQIISERRRQRYKSQTILKSRSAAGTVKSGIIQFYLGGKGEGERVGVGRSTHFEGALEDDGAHVKHVGAKSMGVATVLGMSGGLGLHFAFEVDGDIVDIFVLGGTEDDFSRNGVAGCEETRMGCPPLIGRVEVDLEVFLDHLWMKWGYKLW